MRICVFGLGYVGVVTSACLAEDEHDITGIDVSTAKVELVNAGRSPIVEESISDLISKAVASGRLRATTDSREILLTADMAIVCVGTPSRAGGALDHSYVEQVAEEIGTAIRSRKNPLLVVFRSTMVPGMMRELVVPALQRGSGESPGRLYRVVFHPEFLREGSSVRDFYAPPKIVVGEDQPGDAAAVFAMYSDKYKAPRIACAIEVAEMVKYCDNLYHAVKITFANEVGQFCHAHGIDSHVVMDIFCQDTKLNISPAYLKPGFAFGGSCLPKDLRAFLAAASGKALSLPMLQGILPSNRHQVERVLEIVLATGARTIGFHGLAFKQGTDDLRESPYVELGERLLGKGKVLSLFDPDVEVSRLVGRNKSYIEVVFPHLSNMLVSDGRSLDACDLILLCHRPASELMRHWKSRGCRMIDLTGMLRGGEWSNCVGVV